MKHPSLTKALLASALVAFIAGWFFLFNLGASSISLGSDEIIYTRVTQSVLHKGTFFPLQHGNAPTYEKPPLKLWLGAVAPALFGEGNFSFRALDGALGVATVALTIALALKITGSLPLALLSGLALLGMPELVISHHGFRRAVLDGLLTTLTVISCWLTWSLIKARDEDRSKLAILIGVVCALGVLTKSVAGFVPAICATVAFIICSGVLVTRDIRQILTSCRPVFWIVGIPVVTFVAYLIALWSVAGSKGISIFIGVEILTRTFHGFEGHNTGSSWFYLWSLFIRGSAVPRYLLIVGVAGAVLTCFKDPRSRFLLIWAFLPVALYSLSASKVPWYINPFLPFISIVSFWGALKARDLLGKRVWVKRVLSIALCALTLPAYWRAIDRHARFVLNDNKRIEIDLLVSELRARYDNFVILEDSVSGRSNPIKGRFNLEGIYRETLRPGLRSIKELTDYAPQAGDVVFVKEGSLAKLPGGWKELGSLKPFGARTWRVVVVGYG
jgi:4-amino-4-deoxy-L-arabinose transferase-like glycosyltransferase